MQDFNQLITQGYSPISAKGGKRRTKSMKRKNRRTKKRYNKNSVTKRRY